MEVLLKECGNTGFDCTAINSLDDLREVSHSHIIVCGGDGTVHRVVNEADLLSNTFSVWPLGSGNDFVRNFPKRTFAELLQQISNGISTPTDLLDVNGKKAAVLVGVGFDAFVAHEAHRNSIKIPALKYLIPVARHMFFYEGIQMRVNAKGLQYNGKVFMLSCGNGYRAGGGFRLFPKASVSDGKMDLLLIEPPTFWQKLKYVWLVNFGKHLNLDIVKYMHTDQMVVELESENLYNTDGDVYRAEQLHIQVIPQAWKLIM